MSSVVSLVGSRKINVYIVQMLEISESQVYINNLIFSKRQAQFIFYWPTSLWGFYKLKKARGK